MVGDSEKAFTEVRGDGVVTIRARKLRLDPALFADERNRSRRSGDYLARSGASQYAHDAGGEETCFSSDDRRGYAQFAGYPSSLGY